MMNVFKHTYFVLALQCVECSILNHGFKLLQKIQKEHDFRAEQSVASHNTLKNLPLSLGRCIVHVLLSVVQ